MRITAEEKDKTQEILLIPTGAVCRFTFALGTREKNACRNILHKIRG